VYSICKPLKQEFICCVNMMPLHVFVVILSVIFSIASTPFHLNGDLFHLFVSMYHLYMGTIKSKSSNNVDRCARRRRGRRAKHKRFSMKRLLDRIATSHVKLHHHYPFISDILIEMLLTLLWVIPVLGNSFYNLLILLSQSICDISVSFVVRNKTPLANAVLMTVLTNSFFCLIDGCYPLMYAIRMMIFINFVYLVNDFKTLKTR
jgi:hypothetical protein